MEPRRTISRVLVVVAVSAAFAAGCGGRAADPGGAGGDADAGLAGTGGAPGLGSGGAGLPGTGGGLGPGGASGTGGAATGGAGAGGAVGPEYAIYSKQSDIFTVYRDGIVAHARPLDDDRTELSVFAATTNPNTQGVEDMTIVVTALEPLPATYPCSPGSVGISVRWYYPGGGSLFNTYDNTNMLSSCTITLTEVGAGPGADLAGTFEGLIHDSNGGRLGVHNGTFRARIVR